MADGSAQVLDSRSSDTPKPRVQDALVDALTREVKSARPGQGPQFGDCTDGQFGDCTDAYSRDGA
jgi:hypothetical protein